MPLLNIHLIGPLIVGVVANFASKGDYSALIMSLSRFNFAFYDRNKSIVFGGRGFKVVMQSNEYVIIF